MQSLAALRVFFDCCELHDLHQMFTYERFVKPAVVHDLGAMKLLLSLALQDQNLMCSTRDHKLSLSLPFCPVQCWVNSDSY